MLESLRDPSDNVEFLRASGECVCSSCGKLYRKHPHALEIPGYDGQPFLRRLCDGTLVKL